MAINFKEKRKYGIMSGNRERIIDFPKCEECGSKTYWVVVKKRHKLFKMCFVTEEYLKGHRWLLESGPYDYKFYKISRRMPIVLSDFDNLVFCCASCNDEATKETTEDIIRNAKIIWGRFLTKQQNRADML